MTESADPNGLPRANRNARSMGAEVMLRKKNPHMIVCMSGYTVPSRVAPQEHINPVPANEGQDFILSREENMKNTKRWRPFNS